MFSDGQIKTAEIAHQSIQTEEETMKKIAMMTAIAMMSVSAIVTAAEDRDIARVISMDQGEQAAGCSVQNATMVYEDSKGQRHTMEYSVAAVGCGG